jgi:hypothetical protein
MAFFYIPYKKYWIICAKSVFRIRDEDLEGRKVGEMSDVGARKGEGLSDARQKDVRRWCPKRPGVVGHKATR